ncbi:hypothetical protein ABT297_04020 [Dactylosporangium sp. NPDC000555]|uniref:hypothetical protein n=1 Tax=Dactylosporangium sp. NPDC000555 TaxID=3154260 RepID=UPI0033253A62
MPMPVLPAGHVVTAAELKQITDQIDSLTAPGWTPYGTAGTIIGASVTNPALGNSTWAARYRRAAGSDIVFCEGRIAIGSTFAPGNGVYRFAVPFNASSSAVANVVGQGFIFDAGTANRQGTIRFESAGFFNIYLHDSFSGVTNAGSGTAWATNDVIAWSLAYQPA